MVTYCWKIKSKKEVNITPAKTFSAQVKEYSAKIGISKSDAEDYITESKHMFGRKVPRGSTLRKDLRLYRSAIYDEPIPTRKQRSKRP
jgi:predicted solute-binding protein